MKRFKRVVVKTTVISKKGKKSIRTPLSVKKNSSTSEASTNARRNVANTSENDCALYNNDDVRSPSFPKTEGRTTTIYCNWEKIRDSLTQATIEDYSLPQNACCWICKTTAIFRCQYCGPKVFLCENCARTTHTATNIFHVMDMWKDNRFVPVMPSHAFVGYGHSCTTTQLKIFKLFDAFGNQHLKQVAVCDCNSHAVTLVRCHFWPGSPERPTVGFHFKLMDLAEKLFLHSQVSLKEFSEIVSESTPFLQPCVVKSMYSILNSGCFEEYRHYKYNLRYPATIIQDLKTCNGTKCPLCPTENGVLIESVDACFGLARKKDRGQNSLISPRHGDLLFSDQNDVDNFVNNYEYGSSGSGIEECSRFHAGEVLPALRSKGKNKLFDEKGVFGRVCRHDFPKSLLSIKHGERISYSVYELKKLKEELHDQNKVVLMYDIACILSRHLRNTGQSDLLSNVTLAIPIFHCYGHKASCQISFGPRRISGVGLTDGEGVERFWSYLRLFSAITKEMAPDKRVDVLTDAALHYGEHLFNRYGPILKAKLTRAVTLSSTIDKELKEILSGLPGFAELASIDIVDQWIKEEADAVVPAERVMEYQWDELYTNALMLSNKLSNELVYAKEEEPHRVTKLEQAIARNERSLKALERKHGVKKRWKESDSSFVNSRQRLMSKKRSSILLRLHRMASERLFLLELKAKYADGQSIAIKLSKQISSVVNNMNRELAVLNSLGNVFTFDEIKDPTDEIYITVEQQSVPSATAIPHQIKKKLVDLVCLQRRCKEEMKMIQEEMARLVTFLQSEINKLTSYAADHPISSAFLLQKVDIYKKYMHQLKSLWGNIVAFPNTDSNEDQFVMLHSLPMSEESETASEQYMEESDSEDSVELEDVPDEWEDL